MREYLYEAVPVSKSFTNFMKSGSLKPDDATVYTLPKVQCVVLHKMSCWHNECFIHQKLRKPVKTKILFCQWLLKDTVARRGL